MSVSDPIADFLTGVRNAIGAKHRKVDVPAMYNVARFRPRYDGKLGDPMLLVGLD